MKGHLTTLLVLYCLFFATSAFGADAPQNQGVVVDLEVTTGKLLEWGRRLGRSSHTAVQDQMEEEVALWPRDVTAAAAMGVMRRRKVQPAVKELLIGSLFRRGLVGREFGMELVEFFRDESGPTLERADALGVLLVVSGVFHEELVPREELVDLEMYAITRDTTDYVRQKALTHAWMLKEPRVFREAVGIVESRGPLAARAYQGLRMHRQLGGSFPPDLEERVDAVLDRVKQHYAEIMSRRNEHGMPGTREEEPRSPEVELAEEEAVTSGDADAGDETIGDGAQTWMWILLIPGACATALAVGVALRRRFRGHL